MGITAHCCQFDVVKTLKICTINSENDNQNLKYIQIWIKK